MLADHFGFEMADAVGVDLADGRAAGGEPARIIIGFEVADQRSDLCAAFAQFAERALQECRLAGAGTGDKVEHQHAGRFESGRAGLAPARRSSSECPAAVQRSGWSYRFLDFINLDRLNFQFPPLAQIRDGLVAARAAKALQARDLHVLSAGVAVHRLPGESLTTSLEPSSGVPSVAMP